MGRVERQTVLSLNQREGVDTQSEKSCLMRDGLASCTKSPSPFSSEGYRQDFLLPRSGYILYGHSTGTNQDHAWFGVMRLSVRGSVLHTSAHDKMAWFAGHGSSAPAHIRTFFSNF